jgi:hypothetical protein
MKMFYLGEILQPQRRNQLRDSLRSQIALPC